MVYVGYNYKKETNKNLIIILRNSQKLLIIFLGTTIQRLLRFVASGLSPAVAAGVVPGGRRRRAHGGRRTSHVYY